MQYLRFITVFSFIATCHCAYTQITDSTTKIAMQVLPSILHTPESSWGFGATLLGFVTPADSAAHTTNFQLFLDVTLMKQASFQTDFNIFTKKNKHYIQGNTDLSIFPEFYFGLGNDTKVDDYCLIDLRFVNAKSTFYTVLKNNWYAGAMLHFQNMALKNKTIVHNGFEVNDMGYFSSGSGIAFLLDKRNNILNPSKGHYVATNISRYFDLNKNTDGFLSHTLDARYYHTFKKLIFNSNLYTVHTRGTVPFRMMPAIGGARFLRGYYAGRFRDNNMALAQIEFRRPLFWRLGIAAFTGVAQVYSSTPEFHLSRFHYNYGGGLRVKLNKHSEANIRLDYGRTADSDGFYIVFGECF